MAVVCKEVNLLALVSLFLLAIGGYDDEKTSVFVAASRRVRSTERDRGVKKTCETPQSGSFQMVPGVPGPRRRHTHTCHFYLTVFGSRITGLNDVAVKE